MGKQSCDYTIEELLSAQWLPMEDDYTVRANLPVESHPLGLPVFVLRTRGDGSGRRRLGVALVNVLNGVPTRRDTEFLDSPISWRSFVSAELRGVAKIETHGKLCGRVRTALIDHLRREVQKTRLDDETVRRHIQLKERLGRLQSDIVESALAKKNLTVS